MSKDSNTQHRATRQHPPIKIIVERHYVGTEKMETVFKRIAEEQITKRVKEIAIKYFVDYYSTFGYNEKRNSIV